MHPYMKAFLIVIIAILCTTYIHSQVEFDISLRVGNSITSSETYNRSYNYTQREQITEDQYLEYKGTSNFNYETSYNKVVRFEIEGSVVFPLTKRIHIRTGLALAYQQIEIESMFLDANTTISSVDTIAGMIPTSNGNSGFKPCQYENPSFDFTTPNDISSIWNLLIPLELEYDIIDKLALRVGGYLQTPIISNHTSYSIGSETIEEFEDHLLCRYVLNTVEETNGSRFNDLVLGFSLGTSYRIGNHLGIEFMYRHSFDGTYSDTDNSLFIFNRNQGEFRNRSIMIGLSYKFSDHEGHEEIAD